MALPSLLGWKLRPVPALVLALLMVGGVIAIITVGTIQASSNVAATSAKLAALSELGDGLNRVSTLADEWASDLHLRIDSLPGSEEPSVSAGDLALPDDMTAAIEDVRGRLLWLADSGLPQSTRSRISNLSEVFESHVAVIETFRQMHGDPKAALTFFHTRVDPNNARVRRALLEVRTDISNVAIGEVMRTTRAGTTLMVAGPMLLLLGGAVAVGTLLSSERKRRQRVETLEHIASAKDEFIASVSHELRTPLTAVVGFASELDEAWEAYDQQEIRHLVGIIRQQGKEVANIVEDLLVAARSEASQVNVFLEPLDLGGEITAAVSLAGRPQTTWNPPSDPIMVSADPIRLRQILRNLCTNAARYGGPHVDLTIRSEGGLAFVEVADDGSGVSEELRSRLFKPYSRGDHGAAQTASIGLGLAVSKNLATLMGGDLTYERRPGRSVFVLTLPLSPVMQPSPTG